MCGTGIGELTARAGCFGRCMGMADGNGKGNAFELAAVAARGGHKKLGCFACE